MPRSLIPGSFPSPTPAPDAARSGSARPVWRARGGGSARPGALTALVCGALVAGACGGLELEDRPLEGHIDGEAWSFSAGSAEIRELDGQGELLAASLYAGTDEPCAPFGQPEDADDRNLLWSIPAEPGEHELGLSDAPTVTFSYPQEGGTPFNNIAHRGTIVIDDLGSEAVTGGLVAEADSDNYANGSFELTRCDQSGD